VWHARRVRFALLGLVLAACGSSQAPPAGTAPISNVAPAAPVDAAIEVEATADAVFVKMTAFSAAMCACADQACADRVLDDMTAWGEAEARANRDHPKLGHDEMQRLSTLTEQLTKCMTRAMMPSTGPAGSTGSAGSAATP
jgi:hypothetical protein